MQKIKVSFAYDAGFSSVLLKTASEINNISSVTNTISKKFYIAIAFAVALALAFAVGAVALALAFALAFALAVMTSKKVLL